MYDGRFNDRAAEVMLAANYELHPLAVLTPQLVGQVAAVLDEALVRLGMDTAEVKQMIEKVENDATARDMFLQEVKFFRNLQRAENRKKGNPQ